MKKRDNQKADQKANERASQRASQKHKDGDDDEGAVDINVDEDAIWFFNQRMHSLVVGWSPVPKAAPPSNTNWYGVLISPA